MKQHATPSISVCMATYNGQKYIYEQLQSILPQLAGEDEIIISDDHSTDRTLEIVQAINDPRIKIVTNPGEKGYTSNFENALKHAAGTYIFLADQDDVWKENKVEVSLKHLQQYDFVASDAEIIDAEGRLIEASYFQVRRPNYSPWGNLAKCGILGCCQAFTRKVADKALPFPPNRNLCAYDHWICLLACWNFRYKIIQEPLIAYRRHGENTSTGGTKSETSLYFKMLYRAYVAWHLLKRKWRN